MPGSPVIGGPGRVLLVLGVDVFVSVFVGSVLVVVSGLVGVVVVVGVLGGGVGVDVTVAASLPIGATLSNFSAGLPLR